MAIDHADLKTRLSTTQPYKPHWDGGRDRQLFKLVNQVKQGAPNRVRRVLTAEELQGAVVGTEYLLLTAAQRDQWHTIQRAVIDRPVDLTDPVITGQIDAIWAQGTQTRTNLNNRKQRQASDAELWYGPDTVISEADIRKARAL